MAQPAHLALRGCFTLPYMRRNRVSQPTPHFAGAFHELRRGAGLQFQLISGGPAAEHARHSPPPRRPPRAARALSTAGSRIDGAAGPPRIARALYAAVYASQSCIAAHPALRGRFPRASAWRWPTISTDKRRPGRRTRSPLDAAAAPAPRCAGAFHGRQPDRWRSRPTPHCAGALRCRVCVAIVYRSPPRTSRALSTSFGVALAHNFN